MPFSSQVSVSHIVYTNLLKSIFWREKMVKGIIDDQILADDSRGYLKLIQ